VQGGVGIELWTMTEDILFDNIYVGHSVDDARSLAQESYAIKHPLEEVMPEPAADEPSAVPSFQENPVGFVREKVLSFVDAAKADPVAALKSQPETAAGLAAGVFTLFGMLGALLGLVGGSQKPITKVRSAGAGGALSDSDRPRSRRRRRTRRLLTPRSRWSRWWTRPSRRL
jgi:hypothetical protein